MRTRKKNKETRFNYGAEVYGLSSDDEEGPDDPAARRASRQDKEDVNFDVNASASASASASGTKNDDDVGVGMEEGEDDNDLAEDLEDGEDGEEVIAVDSDSGRAAPKRPKKKKQRRRLSGHVHEVPGYPTDIRQTRIYVGLLKRWTRHHQLADLYYGTDNHHLSIVYEMMNRWMQHHVFPAKNLSDKGGVMASPWLAKGFERFQENRYTSWMQRSRAQQKTRSISAQSAQRFITQEGRDLKVLLGPHGYQKEYALNYGRSLPISQSGTPIASGEGGVMNGWLLDVGGLVLSMKWAPARGQSHQILAMAVIPHSDQAYRESDEDGEENDRKDGCVQFWRFPTTNDPAGVVRPASGAPQLFRAACFDWGRPKRMEWCPVPLHIDGVQGLLAILNGDGQVRVISVKGQESNTQAEFDWIDDPIATLGLTDEYNVATTCLSWVNINRICLGHSDGSISLWSISPCQLMARHAVHISQIIDISSGYPSMPYMIASIPVGGCPQVTDLSLPSIETSYIPLPGAVNFQPDLISWNDHLQGYFGIHPSPTPANTVIGFTHVRYYVQSRTLFAGPTQPTCVSSGTCHPFVLVGSADGSVWAFSALKSMMRDRGDEVLKLKVFQHDFRPVEKIASLEARAVRGVSRVLQGFLPETNNTGRTDYQKGLTEARLKGKKNKQKKTTNRGRKPQGPVVKEEMDIDDEDVAPQESTSETRFAIQEPLTRITAVAWNPNLELGWWAAAAMGSGLVRVMDLGVECDPGQAEPIDVDAET